MYRLLGLFVIALTTLTFTTAQDVTTLPDDPHPYSSPPKPPNPPKPPKPCTTTITKPPGCCPKQAAHTRTSYTNCHNCALEIKTTGPHCDIFCNPNPPIDPDKTTTLTKCKPSPPPGPPDGTEATPPTPTTTGGQPPYACTTTAYMEDPYPCGDCGLGTNDVTTSMNCQGCILETHTTKNGDVGLCECPTEAATRTVSVCQFSVEAVRTGPPVV